MHNLRLWVAAAALLTSITGAVSECGAKDLRASGRVMTLTSPGYPDLYPSDTDCTWTISSDEGKEIVITVDDVFIEDTQDCSSDWLSIFSGPEAKVEKRLAHLCGRGETRTIRTGSSRVTVTFRSDVSVEERGFRIQYHAGLEEGCEQELTSLSGVITSPHYPSNYPDQSSCATLVRLPPGQRVYLSFQDLTLEYDDGCKSDYVEVFDGRDKNSPSLGRFCDFETARNLQSTSNEMLVVFASDGLVNAKGFNATYSTDGFQGVPGLKGRCAWDKLDQNGSISSPNYPDPFPRDSDCSIELTGERGTRIVFVFQDLDIPDCANSYVELQDGNPKRSPTIQRFCGDLSKKRFYSRSNKLTVIFKSNGGTSGRGFKANYFISDTTAGVSGSVRPLDASSLAEFELYPSNASVEEGKILVLRCKSNKGYHRWFKDTSPLEPSTLPNYPNLRLEDEETLVISSMKTSNAGIYSCQAYTSEGTFTAHAWIKLADSSTCPSKFGPRSLLPKEVVISEGKRVTLDCKGSSRNVRVSWHKNGRALRGHKVVIPAASVTDTGVYQCLVHHNDDNCWERQSTALLVIPEVSVCGQPKIEPNKAKPEVDNQNRIVGGREATRGSYPWQAVFFHKTLNLYFCGGSLVTDQWVLTAAHCYMERLYDAADTQVKLGKNNVNRREPGEVVAEVAQLVVHHMYDKGVRNDHDIAMVKLDRRVTFSEFVLPVCMEVASGVFKEGTFHPGTVTGWGTLAEDGKQPAVLQELVLPIQPRSKCTESTYHVVTENMFCAGYDHEIVGAHIKKDACDGDSGGPFVVKVRGHWVVVGVVSWGEGCARKGQYGFYTKVDKYHQWIKEVTGR